MCQVLKIQGIGQFDRSLKSSVPVKRYVATEDIRVWKMLRKTRSGYSSPIYTQNWKMNKTYKVNLTTVREQYDGRKYTESKYGLYTWTTHWKPSHMDGRMIPAVIPKGSTYYMSHNGKVVISNALKLIEKIDRKIKLMSQIHKREYDLINDAWKKKKGRK